MRVLRLPRYQYTLRDMKLGAMFIGYSNELSLSHSVVFVEVIGKWLKRHSVKTGGTVWQSDGGSEFIGSWNAKRKSCFIKKIEEIGGEHYQIPKVTYNADVETVHNTIESEFYDIEVFKETGEDIDERVLTLPVLDLDMLLEYKLNKRYPQGGHDLPWMLSISLFFLDIY